MEGLLMMALQAILACRQTSEVSQVVRKNAKLQTKAKEHPGVRDRPYSHIVELDADP